MIKKWTKEKGFVEIREGVKALKKGDVFFTLDSSGKGPLMVAKADPHVVKLPSGEKFGIKADFYYGEITN